MQTRLLDKHIEKAIKQGNLKSLKSLYEEENLIYRDLYDNEEEVVDQKGLKALHLSVCYGHLDVVKYLCEEQQNNVNVLDRDGRSPLHLAVQNEKIAIVSYLCRQPAIQINSKDKKHYTALQYAIIKDNWEMINDICQHPQVDLVSAFQFAILKSKLTAVRYFCENYPKLMVNAAIEEALLVAIKKNKEDIDILVEIFIRNFFLWDKMKVPLIFSRILHTAACCGRTEIVEFVCENKYFDVSLKDLKIALDEAAHSASQAECDKTRRFISDTIKCLNEQAESMLRQQSITIEKTIQHIDLFKRPAIFHSIKQVVEARLGQMQKNDLFYPLKDYFNNWNKSHWYCFFGGIDPNRYIFAYMLLNATPRHRENLMDQLMLCRELHSASTENCFRSVIRRIKNHPETVTKIAIASCKMK